MRCFIAVDLDKQIQKKIEDFQKELSKKELFRGTYTKPEHIHLTLKFLGEINSDQLASIQTQLEQVAMPVCKACIDRIGIFSPTSIRIIWLHLTGVDELQKAIDTALKQSFPEEQRFMGHITLARPRHILDKRALVEKIKTYPWNPLSCTISSFKLKKSVLTNDGPTYTTIQEYFLRDTHKPKL